MDRYKTARVIINFIRQGLNVTGSAVPLSVLSLQRLPFNRSAGKNLLRHPRLAVTLQVFK